MSNNIDIVSADTEKPKELMKCRLCSFKTFHQSLLIFHLRKHAKQNYSCDFCSESIQTVFEVHDSSVQEDTYVNVSSVNETLTAVGESATIETDGSESTSSAYEVREPMDCVSAEIPNSDFETKLNSGSNSTSFCNVIDMPNTSESSQCNTSVKNSPKTDALITKKSLEFNDDMYFVMLERELSSKCDFSTEFVNTSSKIDETNLMNSEFSIMDISEANQM